MQQRYILIFCTIALLIKVSYACNIENQFDAQDLMNQAAENMSIFPAQSKYNMAIAHDAQGSFLQALDWYEQAYNDPNATLAIKGAVLNNVAVLLQAHGYVDRANNFFNEGVKYGGSYIFYNIGLLYWNAGQISTAERYFELARKKSSDQRILVNMGECSYRLGQIDHAKYYWYSAWEKYKDMHAAYNMGILAVDVGDWITAKGWMKKAAEYGSQQAQAFLAPQCSARSKAKE